MWSSFPSRKESKPATWSTSALVRKTPEMGELRGELGLGAKTAWVRICSGKSGDALMRNQLPDPSPTATEDWVWGRRKPLLACWQLAQAQFHCGRPPPAATPNSRTRIMASRPEAGRFRRLLRKPYTHNKVGRL